jgi:hypothetical protein
MGKGSGSCDARPGISLEASGAKTELNLSGEVAEINTTLKLQRVDRYWWTKDQQVAYGKREEGWIVDSTSDPIRKAFEEYGISYEHTHFPSLKAVRQAVRDVSLEVGLNIDSRLTRGKYASYKIGDLPLNIKREESYWRVYTPIEEIDELPPILEKYFNSTQEFLDAWTSADIRLVHYPTQKAAHQAVTNWLAQTISKSNTLNKEA